MGMYTWAAAAVLDWFMKDVILACKKCPELAQVSSFCPFVRKSRASQRLHIGQRERRGDPQKLKDLRPLLCTLGPKPILHHKLVNIHLAHRLLMDYIIVHNVFMLQVDLFL